MSHQRGSGAQPLSQASVGECVEIVDLVGDQQSRWRLLDLGLVAGTRVEVVRRSPLGDPVMYRVRGTLIALRQPDADLVQVRTSVRVAAGGGRGGAR